MRPTLSPHVDSLGRGRLKSKNVQEGPVDDNHLGLLKFFHSFIFMVTYYLKFIKIHRKGNWQNAPLCTVLLPLQPRVLGYSVPMKKKLGKP